MSAPPTMTAIPDMDPSRHLVSVSAGFGNQWFQEIQRALITQFANIGTAVITPTAGNLNSLVGIDSAKTVETRFTDIEAFLVRQDLSAPAYNFHDSWWSQDATAVPERQWVAAGRRDGFTNVPWAWGTNIPSGKEDDVIVVFIERVHATSTTGVAYQTALVLFPDSVQHRDYFWRAASNMTTITNEPWRAFEYALVDDAESTSGDATYSTVCFTINEVCT